MRPRGLWPTAGRWDIPCAPGCSRLLPCDPGNFVPIFLAFVLLVSDAPFRNRQQQFVLLRVGKGAWIGGQLMYILFTSVVLQLPSGSCPGFSSCRTWHGGMTGARF